MIFWFSGTGNSKWVAERLAAALGDRVYAIGECMKSGKFRFELQPQERIGFVFPIHSWGPAPIVLEFINKFHLDGYKRDNYCYMVCTCGDDIGNSVSLWRKALGRIEGNAAFSVQMPNTYIILPGFNTDSKEIESEKLRKAESRIEDIITAVAERRNKDEVVTGGMAWAKTSLVYPVFRRFGRIDSGFKVDRDKCISCGICAGACPVENIEMKNGHPVWNGDCEMCLGCIHSCPQRAVEYFGATKKKGRYRHP